MRSQKIALKETAFIAAGVAACVGVMLLIYYLLGRLDRSVLLGGLVGGVLAVGNFFFLAVFATLAADKAEQQDVTGGQKLVQSAYLIRLLVLAVVLFACAKSGYVNVLALVLPLAFVRPTIMLAEFFRKKGG